MTAALLTAWNMDPVVDKLTISAGEAAVTSAERTQVTGLQKTATGMRWYELDEALPLPLDLDNAMTEVLLGVSDIERVDQESLRVTGLAKGSYQLLVDKKLIGTFPSDALERGINLALMKTPMLDQARGIDWESERRAMLDQAHFILSAETAKTPDPVPAEERLRLAEDELAATIRKQAVPKLHDFELRRTTDSLVGGANIFKRKVGEVRGAHVGLQGQSEFDGSWITLPFLNGLSGWGNKLDREDQIAVVGDLSGSHSRGQVPVCGQGSNAAVRD